MKAVITAAGMGTRFLPASKAVPKEMLPLLDKPVIQHVVEEALDSSADEVIVVNSPEKTLIERHFAEDTHLADVLEAKGKTALADAVRHAASLPVSFVYQQDPTGLGHAVLTARESCGAENFFVLLGDVVVPGHTMLARMEEISAEHGGASVIAVIPVPDEEVSRFGVIGGQQLSADVWKIEELVEKPPADLAPSNLAIFGRYLLTPRVFELLAETAPGAGDEVQLTDALASLLEEEEMYAYVVDPQDGFDVGTVATWAATNTEFARRAGL